MLLYHYGPVAWLWRLLAFGGMASALGLCLLAWREGAVWPLGVALPLALPGLLLPMVAVRVRQPEPGWIVVDTLLFWRRTLPQSALGEPRFKSYAQGTVGGVHAPRIWVPVRGSWWPVHVDLLGHIPDRRAFLSVFRLPGSLLPGK